MQTSLKKSVEILMLPLVKTIDFNVLQDVWKWKEITAWSKGIHSGVGKAKSWVGTGRQLSRSLQYRASKASGTAAKICKWACRNRGAAVSSRIQNGKVSHKGDKEQKEAISMIQGKAQYILTIQCMPKAFTCSCLHAWKKVWAYIISDEYPF